MKTGCALCFGWEILERATFNEFQKTYTSCRFWRLIPTEYVFLFFRDSFEAIKYEFLVRDVTVKGWKCGKMVPLWWCPLTESSKITSRFDNQQTFQFGILTEIPAKIASKKMPTEWCSNPFCCFLQRTTVIRITQIVQTQLSSTLTPLKDSISQAFGSFQPESQAPNIAKQPLAPHPCSWLPRWADHGWSWC